MSGKVTTDHIDERFDVVEQRLESLSQKADANVQAIDALDQKIDANAEAAEARFHILEAQLPGHSDEQIIEIIDARLQAVLPDMLREAVTDGLRTPLTTLKDHTERLDKLQPLSDALKTTTDLRRFILWTAPVLTTFLTIAAVITIVGAFT